MTRARKYLILDTETATLPFVNGMVQTVVQKRTLAIAKPLIYDIAWKIVDRNGNIYSEHSYLVSEIFCVPAIFDTAYYHHKKPIYLERLANGETSIKRWDEIMDILIKDLKDVAFVGAFNSMFDYKKAIPFTEKYIRALHSSNYYDWERKQKQSAENILRGEKRKNPDWDGMNFNFRGENYPLIDLWGIACEMLINTQTYKRKCLQHDMITESGLYFKSSAETTFRYMCEKYDFEELHMAIDDVNIECEILIKALKKGKITEGLQYFPFQMLGKTTKFVLQGTKRKLPLKEVEAVAIKIESKLEMYENQSSYTTALETELLGLLRYIERVYPEVTNWNRKKYAIELKRAVKAYDKLKNKIFKSTKKQDEQSHNLAKMEDEIMVLQTMLENC